MLYEVSSVVPLASDNSLSVVLIDSAHKLDEVESVLADMLDDVSTSAIVVGSPRSFKGDTHATELKASRHATRKAALCHANLVFSLLFFNISFTCYGV